MDLANILITRRFALLLTGAAVLEAMPARAARPVATVHKDPSCGCCNGWIAHLNDYGFPVVTRETGNMELVRTQLGVAHDLASCHTAEIAGYVIEGHVPAALIDRLLNERPPARGLAAPGMPQGSPGMSGVPEEYDVILFGPGQRRVYARFKGTQEIRA